MSETIKARPRPIDLVRPVIEAGPPVNVQAALQNVGVLVRESDVLPDDISGHLKLLPNGRYEAAATASEHPYRRRFTLAHELGHFILHRSIIDEVGGVDDDTMYRSTSKGDIYNDHIELTHEKQANSFAANLLMPRAAVLEALDHPDHQVEGRASLMALMRAFQVSPSAMRWRLKNLDVPKSSWRDDQPKR